MKYSLIFCYRNRREHLNLVIPQVHKLFEPMGKRAFEIIVIEQDDNEKFRRANTLNEGALAAEGDILVFSDIDYYPTTGTRYWFEDGQKQSDIFLPVHRVEFVQNDLSPRPENEIPRGYRHFKNGVDANFFGGVISFKRDAFFKINGFNPMYVGWGLEDADLRCRIEVGKLTYARSQTNLFYALEHPDSGVVDLHYNNSIFTDWQLYQKYGVTTQQAVRKTISRFSSMHQTHHLVDKWITVKEFAPT